MMESTISRENRDSVIMLAAWCSNCSWWSALYALAYATLSKVSFSSSPNRLAIATNLIGLNVPSVSMYKHFPSPPPLSIGSWQVTARVWQSCDFPVLNSPNTSVMAPVSTPPPRSVSSCLDPVVRQISSDLLWWNSVAVVNPRGTSLDASINNLSAFNSEIPFTVTIWRFGVYAIDSTVWKPASFSFLISWGEIPFPTSCWIGTGPAE
ncbi:hypothetical protein OGAPHI_002710 [Ogataea philodendri]|uniref:Uncharacterized protein n=1 Tax=Ogataea philodendri TaxID=1378263 RepID=A0A9P8PC40_9ASCO|nr:uncharacterized protein OGAPHI_002710 [Ogataea philodendri]KAH3668955.1 hypothetical protein OGAPHI_002710 [Ogataea philodendri]